MNSNARAASTCGQPHRQALADRLLVPQRRAERAALLDPVERELDRLHGLAHRLRGEHDALVLEVLDQRVEAAALLAQHVLLRHAAVLEHQLGRVAGEPAVLVERAGHLEAGRALLDGEHGDARGCGRPRRTWRRRNRDRRARRW